MLYHRILLKCLSREIYDNPWQNKKCREWNYSCSSQILSWTRTCLNPKDDEASQACSSKFIYFIKFTCNKMIFSQICLFVQLTPHKKGKMRYRFLKMRKNGIVYLRCVLTWDSETDTEIHIQFSSLPLQPLWPFPSFSRENAFKSQDVKFWQREIIMVWFQWL